ncbi:hypothetical protein CR513_62277, partial [Mucuna pruriens]
MDLTQDAWTCKFEVHLKVEKHNLKGKQVRQSFESKNIVSTSIPLELLLIDLFGLTRIASMNGKRYGLVVSSRSWELCFRCLTSVNYYLLTRFTHWCETSQNPLCCSQLSMIMAEDKVITLGPNELPNLESSYHLDSRNYLQWTQYIRTTLKGRKKLSHIEGNDPPKDDSKFKACDDEHSLIMTWLWNSITPKIS